MQTYEAYKKVCDAIREAKELLESGEAELAELAREELAEAEPGGGAAGARADTAACAAGSGRR